MLCILQVLLDVPRSSLRRRVVAQQHVVAQQMLDELTCLNEANRVSAADEKSQYASPSVTAIFT